MLLVSTYCMTVCAYIYTHIYINTHTYIHTYTHTYVHTVGIQLWKHNCCFRPVLQSLQVSLVRFLRVLSGIIMPYYSRFKMPKQVVVVLHLLHIHTNKHTYIILKRDKAFIDLSWSKLKLFWYAQCTFNSSSRSSDKI